MKDIDSLLQSFMGYLALGMYAEANDVLENLPTDLKVHPMALLARVELLVEMKKWEDGALLGESLCRHWPGYSEFWFRTAFCLHKLKRSREAKDTLLTAPPSVRETALCYYHLACYEAQLGDMDAAKKLLQIAFIKDTNLRQSALAESDLEVVWNSL